LKSRPLDLVSQGERSSRLKLATKVSHLDVAALFFTAEAAKPAENFLNLCDLSGRGGKKEPAALGRETIHS
jgi:hypothetical protein